MRGVLASLAVAVALAGCAAGQTGKDNAYVDAVNRAQARFAATVHQLSGRPGAKSSRRTLRSFDAAVGRVVGNLRAITPPDRVAALHRRLVARMDAYGRQVRRETALLRSGDAARVVAAQQRLLAATEAVGARINALIDAINRRLRA
ncbi:MAG TPA: hypothetical protein VGJ32_11615 [Solirubrobacteraceae bacterium]|jgi:hypothetical protein